MKEDKRRKAVAMRYDQTKETAPRITAAGKGLVAENIIELANQHHVPIQKDETMVELLANLEINEKIPEELYQAVAEVFAFLYRADKRD